MDADFLPSKRVGFGGITKSIRETSTHRTELDVDRAWRHTAKSMQTLRTREATRHYLSNWFARRSFTSRDLKHDPRILRSNLRSPNPARVGGEWRLQSR